MNVVKAHNRHSSQRDARSDISTVVRETPFASGRVRLDTAVASSPGRFHPINEDWYSVLDATVPLFVVADGVGSGAMASSASRELVSRLHDVLERERIDAEAIRRAVLIADREVRRSIASRTDASGAATVALCAATDVSLSRWLVAWVGDCRVYRVSATRDEPAQLLTRDDTYRHLRERPPPGGSLDDPARMVGNGAVDAPNVCDVELGRDEMLLLCSDGIHKHAGPRDMSRLLRRKLPLATRCGNLIDFARASGSSDDATVLVVQRSGRPRAGLARLISLGVLITVVAGALLWLAADWAAAHRLSSASTPISAGMQP